MKEHHRIMLQEAEDLLSKIDSSEFLDDFLELQENSCGMTVDGFFTLTSIPTYSIFGLDY